MSRQKSLTVSRRVAVYVTVLVVVLTAHAQAVRPIGNTTPKNKTCRVFVPIGFDMGDGGAHETRVAVTTKDGPGGWAGEGYISRDYIDNDLTNHPKALVSKLTLRTGVRFWWSHSNSVTIRFEAYDSEDDREDAFAVYESAAGGGVECWRGRRDSKERLPVRSWKLALGALLYN